MITSITISSLTIGTWTSGYLFKSLSGFDFPAPRIDIKYRGNKDGARLGSYFYGDRTMSIEGEIVGSSASDYETKRRALQAAFCIGEGLKTMTIVTRGGTTLTSSVIVTRLELPYTAGKIIRGDFRIEVKSPYQNLLGETLNSQEVVPYEGGGGAIPAGVPFDMSAGGTGAQTLANDGNAYAWPTITIIGGIENPSVQNQTTGKSISITYTLGSSTDNIVLDFYNRTCIINGSINGLQYVSGEWFPLISGNNAVILTAGSNTGSAKATVEWYDEYLGI